jgi:hypothetical protein
MAEKFKMFSSLNYINKHTLHWPVLHIAGVGRPASASAWGRTVNQRSVGKARERWHVQGGTWGLVEGLYWCVGLLLPMYLILAFVWPYEFLKL